MIGQRAHARIGTTAALLLCAAALPWAMAPAACLGRGGSDRRHASGSQPADMAEVLFAIRCAICHGRNGAGDSPVWSTLYPRPRRFVDKRWQKSVDDRHIEKVIVYGGTVAGLSPAMPPNPDLASSPDIVARLRATIRRYGN